MVFRHKKRHSGDCLWKYRCSVVKLQHQTCHMCPESSWSVLLQSCCCPELEGSHDLCWDTLRMCCVTLLCTFEQWTPWYFWYGHPAVCPCPGIQQVPSVQVALHKALGHGRFLPLCWGSVLWGAGTFLKPSAASSLPQTSTAMGSSVTTSCMSCSRRPACLSLATKWERSSRSSWLMATRIKMGRSVLKSLSM